MNADKHLSKKHVLWALICVNLWLRLIDASS